MNTVKIIISPTSVLITLAFLILVWIIYRTIDVLLLFFAALFIAAKTLGFIGVFLSPVIVSVIYILVNELYVKKINPSER